jgi:chromosome segregation ATPase
MVEETPSMRSFCHLLPALSIAALGLVAPSIHAQSARSGGGASAQLLQQMQQLASERTSLQAQNAKLKKDLEDLRKDRDALENSQQAMDKRAKSSEAALKQQQQLAQRQSGANEEIAQTKEKLQQLVGKFRETLQTLKEVETAQATATQTLATRDQELKVCVDHNRALYKLDDEVLTHMEHQTVWTQVASSEPFTRIKRTQLENYVVESRGKADEHAISPANTTPAAPASASSAPH